GNVIDALEGQGSRARVLFASSTGVYGEDAGGWVDESTPPDPRGFSGEQLLAAEERLARSPLVGAALRLSGIYWPSRKVLLGRVAQGLASYPARGERWMNQIHEEDAARAVLHAIGLDPLPPTICVSDGEPADRRVMLGWLARRMGAPEPTEGAPGSAGAGKRVSSRLLISTGFAYSFPTYREGYGSFLDSAPDGPVTG
ncbi:MAG: SDR family NAD(P)-dependent oxidoreductase, partial [Planctomycetota bacterium]